MEAEDGEEVESSRMDWLVPGSFMWMVVRLLGRIIVGPSPKRLAVKQLASPEEVVVEEVAVEESRRNIFFIAHSHRKLP